MDIKVSMIGYKTWRFTDTTFYYDKTEYALEDIKHIVISRECPGVLFMGEVFVTLQDGTDIRLPFSYKDRKKAVDAVFYTRARLKIEDKPKKSIFRKRCKLCGAVYSYTLTDLERNEELRKKALREAVHGVTEVFGGTTVGATLSRKNSEDALNKVVDYGRCPKCGSPEVADITDEEFKQMQETAEKPATTAISAADELKKFKELLDAGVITQEEFDAKKKQLLGL